MRRSKMILSIVSGFAAAAAGLAAVAVSAPVAVVLAGCSAPEPPPPSDPEVLRLENAARSAFDSGEMERAARYYDRVLRIGRARDDALLIGNAAYNFAVCEYALGRVEAARVALEEAAAELDRCGESPADALLLAAQIARHEGRSKGAAELCSQIAQLSEEDAAPETRLQAWVIQTLLACDGGDVTAAEAALSRTARLLPETDDPLAHAGAAQAAGCVRALRGDHAAAAASFDREAQCLSDAGRYFKMARALVRAADAHAAAENSSAAGDRYFRAARSFLALGEISAARDAADSAVGATKVCGDEELAARCRALRNEVQAKK